MFIREFHARFTSKRETGRLFDVLRRVSRLSVAALPADDTVVRWPEWPPIDPSEPELGSA